MIKDEIWEFETPPICWSCDLAMTTGGRISLIASQVMITHGPKSHLLTLNQYDLWRKFLLEQQDIKPLDIKMSLVVI